MGMICSGLGNSYLVKGTLWSFLISSNATEHCFRWASPPLVRILCTNDAKRTMCSGEKQWIINITLLTRKLHGAPLRLRRNQGHGENKSVIVTKPRLTVGRRQDAIGMSSHTPSTPTSSLRGFAFAPNRHVNGNVNIAHFKSFVYSPNQIFLEGCLEGAVAIATKDG